jgi:hypothetical protein
MYPFRRLALLLALGLPAMHAVLAQSSSSAPPTATPDQVQAQQPAAGAQQQLSVQARIRARRAQRRAAAIHDAYAHRYDAYAGLGYLRFTPGASLQRVTLYAWNTDFTRYYNERLGVTLDGRGYYGTPFVGLNPSGITKPAISAYTAMAGPTYRFYLQPKYAISGRIMAGYAKGNFTGDTNGFGNQLGTGKPVLYPDGSSYAGSVSIVGEYNVTPNIALRLAPEYFATGFGSTTQNSLGFTAGFVYRFGKQ